MVEIKFRKPQRLEAARRLDPELRRMAQALREKDLGPESEAQLRSEMAAREDALGTTYLQIAQQLADLHDTPGRMISKGVISSIVPFKRARSYFYWRLRRRLAEFSLRRQVS